MPQTRTIHRILCMCFIAAALPAYAHGQGGVVLGAKVGWSSSKLKIENPDDVLNGSISSLTGGGFLRFGAGKIGIQPELMVVTKGSKVDDVDVTGELKLDYIEVPLLLVFSLSSSSISPYLLAGPAFSFEIKCGISGRVAGQDIEQDCDDTANDRKKFDLGVMAGGGVSIPVGPGSLLFEARYNYGLTNLNKDDSTGTGSVKNRSLGILAGFSIALGSR